MFAYSKNSSTKTKRKKTNSGRSPTRIRGNYTNLQRFKIIGRIHYNPPKPRLIVRVP